MFSSSLLLIAASKRTQSLLDFRHILPTHMALPPTHRPTVTDLDQPDSASQILNNNSNRKMSTTKINNDEEKRSIADDPIYHTISSEKSGMKLGRNCISLENLRTLTIKNDLNSYGNNLLQNYSAEQQSNGYYVLPTFPPPPIGYHHYFGHKPHQYMLPLPPSMLHHQHQQPMFQQNYRTPFTNYGGYTTSSPYFNVSNANSRQSIGNESDDYRKYRDVAL